MTVVREARSSRALDGETHCLPAPRERPIVFSSPMVRQILAGKKTMTRRLVKNPPRHWSEWLDVNGQWHPTGYTKVLSSHDGLFIQSVYPEPFKPAKPSPYGVVGDLLWVRETWMELYDAGDGSLTCLPPTGESTREALRRAKYRADGEKPQGFAASWKSPRYMPRWASRITLEVTEIRAERLQSISEEDAAAEGCPCLSCGKVLVSECRCASATADYKRDFARLWDEINGAKAQWASSPWVWVIGFRRLP